MILSNNLFTKTYQSLFVVYRSIFDLPMSIRIVKTVSTKLVKQDFERFQEMCNYEGQCMSEHLRNLIKMGIDACEYYRKYEKKKSVLENDIPPIITKETKIPIPIIHGKILDDDGNVIETF